MRAPVTHPTGKALMKQILRLPHQPRRACHQQTSPNARSAPPSCSATSPAAFSDWGAGDRSVTGTARLRGQSTQGAICDRRQIRPRVTNPSRANPVSSYQRVIAIHEYYRGFYLQRKKVEVTTLFTALLMAPAEARIDRKLGEITAAAVT